MPLSNNILHPLPALLSFPLRFLHHKYAVYYHLEVNNQPVMYKLLGVYLTLSAANKMAREVLVYRQLFREWHEVEDAEGLVGIEALTTALETVRIRIYKVPHDWGGPM
jgi:hypothetical protein